MSLLSWGRGRSAIFFTAAESSRNLDLPNIKFGISHTTLKNGCSPQSQQLVSPKELDLLTSRHWVDKNCLPWANDYLKENLVDYTKTNDTYHVTISQISPLGGDCDVTQRKGKTRCIYDLDLKFDISVKKGDDDEFSYGVRLLEFVHDQDEDEYKYDINGDRVDCKSDIRSFFLPDVTAKLLQFQKDLIEAHREQIQHNT